MKDEPDIIKELREVEKLGGFQSKIHETFEVLDAEESPSDNITNQTTGFFEDETKQCTSDADLTIINNFTSFNELADLLFESTSDMTAYINRFGKILRINPTVEKFSGFTEKELIGKRLWKLPGVISKSELPKILSVLKKVISGKPVRNFTTAINNKSGDKHIVELSFLPIKEKNKLKFILLIGRDKTDLKRTEEELKETEMRFLDLFENSNDLIQAVKPDGSILYVNRAWKDKLGYKEDELPNLNIFDVIHPDCKQHCIDTFKRIMSGEDIEQVEALFVSKDGNVIDVVGSVNCRYKDDKPYSTRGIFHDVTERKKTEEEKKMAEEKIIDAAKVWETTFDSISDLVSIMDDNFLILNANKAYLNTFNLERKDIIGKRCHEIVHSSEKPFPSCPHLQTLKTKKPVSVEFFEPNLGIYLEVSTSPIFDKKGKVVGTTHIAKDISKRKDAEWELQERLKEFTCLYKISDSFRLDNPLEKLLVDATKFIEDAFQYPDITKCRIKLDDKIYENSKFSETKFKLTVDIIVNDKKRGKIEVCCLENRKGKDKNLFLKEEKELLDEIVNYIGSYLEKVENELKLRDKIDELEKYKKLTVGRELRMIELKDRIKELEEGIKK